MRNKIKEIKKLSPLHREYLIYKIYMSAFVIAILLMVINNLIK